MILRKLKEQLKESYYETFPKVGLSNYFSNSIVLIETVFYGLLRFKKTVYFVVLIIDLANRGGGIIHILKVHLLKKKKVLDFREANFVTQ